jgi:frataxin-like iron-binding protein CyaY
MFQVLGRLLATKVRVPTGNFKTKLNVFLPKRQLMDFQEFSSVLDEYWSRLQKSLEDVKDDNPEGKFSFSSEKFRIEVNDFVLNIEKNLEDQTIQVLVGDGVSHNYFYDKSDERWVSSVDGHLMDELLCREVTRKCLGYFKI